VDDPPGETRPGWKVTRVAGFYVQETGVKQVLIVATILAVTLIMLRSVLFACIFVSIVWTHCPDLPVANIAFLAIREIREII